MQEIQKSESWQTTNLLRLHLVIYNHSMNGHQRTHVRYAIYVFTSRFHELNIFFSLLVYTSFKTKFAIKTYEHYFVTFTLGNKQPTTSNKR